MDNNSSVAPVDESSSGFMSGLTNVFSGIKDAATELGGIYEGWSDMQARRDSQEADIKSRELNQNLDMQIVNNQAMSAEAKQKIITYGVVGSLSLAGVYLAYRIFK